MLAWAFQHPADLRTVGAVWDHPRIHEAPRNLRHTRSCRANVSRSSVYRAVLVYNAAMAELAGSRGQHEAALAEEYRASYREWAETQIEPRLSELREWDRGELWSLIAEMLRGGVTRTSDFSERWMTAALADPNAAIDDQSVRSLIAGRERD